MSELLDNFESYVLNDTNMQCYLKYKFFDESENKSKHKKEFKTNIINTPTIFIPRDQDSLFWCYYIIKNGDIQYEMLQNRNILTSKKLKIELVSNIRNNKQIIKTHKFDTISSIENNLANDNNISVQTFMTLCLIDNINIIFVRKKTYFELLINDTCPTYIIREIDNSKLKYSKQYGYEISTDKLLSYIRDNLYRIESLDKPIKSVSSYKLSELQNIANKLAIDIVNKNNGKHKTKTELYELIIQNF